MNKIMQKLSESYQLLSEKLASWLDAIVLNVPNILIALLVATAAYFMSKTVRSLAVKGTKRFTQNRTILNLISNLASVVFTIVVLFVILSIFDLSSTINKILATAGVLGLAVGLALQDPMTNLFSGIMMSVRKLYKIGDVVKTNGHFGVIKDIDLRSTKLKTPRGSMIVIPNKDVIQNPLENYSSSGERRIQIECGVSYGEDLEEVEGIAMDAISQIPGLLESKPVEIVFSEFAGSSINFNIRYWIDTCGQADYVMMISKGIKAIKKAFDENDISIPYPIRTLDFGIKGGVSLKEILPKSQGLEFTNSNN